MFSDAFSPEGFIVRQCACDDVPYAKVNVAYAGCGAIAVYNLCRMLGVPADWEGIKSALEQSVLRGGKWGTSPVGVRRWLSGHGVAVARAYRPKKAEKLAEGSDAGILLYIHKGGAHYVAFKNEGGLLHFYNVGPSHPEETLTLEKFIKNNSSFPFVYLFTVKAGL